MSPRRLQVLFLSIFVGLTSCSSEHGDPPNAKTGAGTGGLNTSGIGTGGATVSEANTGGVGTGGASASKSGTGGAGTGGVGASEPSTGGVGEAGTGGAGEAGAGTGGVGAGGVGTGGVGTGGVGTGGVGAGGVGTGGVGTGGVGTGGVGTGGAASVPVCSSGACCVPVKVDRVRTRAYLVDGVLYFDSFASLVGAARAGEIYWSFDVNLNGDVIPELTCKATHSDDFSRTVSFNACSATPRQPVSCGDRIQISVRLKSDTYDKDAQPSCAGAGLGPATSVELDVACPVCPSRAEQGAQCSFPRARGCPSTAYNHWQMRDETVQCSCGNLLSIDEPRSWSCPVF